MFVHLERLEKERLSLNKMHGLTQFDKWVEKAEANLYLVEKYDWSGSEGKSPGSVIWGSAMEREVAQRKEPAFSFTLAFYSCLTPESFIF